MATPNKLNGLTTKHFIELLRTHHGRVAEVAKELDVKPTNLYRWMRLRAAKRTYSFDAAECVAERER